MANEQFDVTIIGRGPGKPLRKVRNQTCPPDYRPGPGLPAVAGAVPPAGVAQRMSAKPAEIVVELPRLTADAMSPEKTVHA